MYVLYTHLNVTIMDGTLRLFKLIEYQDPFIVAVNAWYMSILIAACRNCEDNLR